MSAARAAVPGNILVLGEYAVVEEGGMGIALAVEPRVRLEASPASMLRVDARWPGASSGTSPLVEAAVHVVSEWLGAPCTGSLVVDSSEFFGPDGRKSGLGSSAAAAAALVCGLLRAAGREPSRAEAASLAVRAHRLAQGGRGSGYDVLASLHGGAGMVRGGASPSWEPARLPPGCRLTLFPGPAPVSTASAVSRYQEWKKACPGPARDFLRENNTAVASFCRAASLEEARASFETCRRLGLELGRAIGVPADIPAPAGLDPAWCKSLGAGNELGVCLAPPLGTLDPAAREVHPVPGGLTWEP